MRKLIYISIITAALTACGPASVDSDAKPNSVIEVTRSGNAEGRTVVLIPGLASSADVWDETETLLQTDYDVRTVQVAGFAGADTVAVDGAYTDAIAEAIGGELRDHPANDAVLVGHSLGGFVSIKAALNSPELIDELVIVDSVPFLAGLFFPGATPEIAAAQAPVMTDQMKAQSRQAFDAQQKSGAGRLSNTADFVPTIAAWGEASDQATVATAMGELLGADLRADIANLETETLVMAAWDEAMGQPRETVLSLYTAQYEAAPNADIQVFEDSFHFIMIDQPDAFHTSLLAALKD